MRLGCPQTTRRPVPDTAPVPAPGTTGDSPAATPAQVSAVPANSPPAPMPSALGSMPATIATVDAWVVRTTRELFGKRWLAPSASSKNYRVVPRPRSADYGKKTHFTNSAATMTASELFAATGALCRTLDMVTLQARQASGAGGLRRISRRQSVRRCPRNVFPSPCR
jgi:hypothetical protein